MMDLQQEKWDAMEKLMKVRNSTLVKKVNDLLDKEMVIAYTVEGDPLTREKYDSRLSEAEQLISSGKFTSQEDLEEESKNW